MKGEVIHGPTGLMLDFAEDDFGGPKQAAIIADWRERARKSGEPQTRKGEFICQVHYDRERPYLYLERRQDSSGNEALFAYHWPGSGIEGACATHRAMTPEHRRLRDYAGRAADNAGIPWKSEVALPGARPDAVVYGPQVHMGVEAQRVNLAPPAAKARTTRQRKAGVTPVWLLLPHAGNRLIGQVLTASVRHTDWTSMPPPRSVMGIISGIYPVRCGDTPDARCQDYPHCRKWHAMRKPVGMPVDEIVEQFPAGTLTPVLYTSASGRRRHVHVVHRNDKAKYEAMIGASADWADVAPEPKSRQPSNRVACIADAGRKIGPPPEASMAPLRAAPADASEWRCDRCGFIRIIDMTGIRHSGCGGRFWAAV